MSDEEDEAERLRTLAEYALLDSSRDPQLDAIVAEAAAQFGTAMSSITLIDRDRQWFKARIGLEARETPLEESFCAVAMRQQNGLVVEDARLDSRFAGMDCVSGPSNIRFYAGAPLTLRNGVRVGTLCVIDTAPRTDFDEEDRAVLAQLATRTVAEFELERDWRREGRGVPGTEEEWLRHARSLLGRASVALERCGATAAVAQLDDLIAQVDELAASEPV